MEGSQGRPAPLVGVVEMVKQKLVKRSLCRASFSTSSAGSEGFCPSRLHDIEPESSTSAQPAERRAHVRRAKFRNRTSSSNRRCRSSARTSKCRDRKPSMSSSRWRRRVAGPGCLSCRTSSKTKISECVRQSASSSSWNPSGSTLWISTRLQTATSYCRFRRTSWAKPSS